MFSSGQKLHHIFIGPSNVKGQSAVLWHVCNQEDHASGITDSVVESLGSRLLPQPLRVSISLQHSSSVRTERDVPWNTPGENSIKICLALEFRHKKQCLHKEMKHSIETVRMELTQSLGFHGSSLHEHFKRKLKTLRSFGLEYNSEKVWAMFCVM